MNDPRILVVAHDADICRVIRTALDKEGLHVLEAATADDARFRAENWKPDLVIVDLCLLGGDSKALISEIRSSVSARILALITGHQETEKCEALDAGADSYIMKPLGVSQFMRHVRAQLRCSSRASNCTKLPPSVGFGEVKINVATHEITRAGHTVHLTRNELRLLTALIAGNGRVLSHRQLLAYIWGPECIERYTKLRHCVARLRRKLGEDPSQPVHLVTEPQVGYRLSGLENREER